MEPEDIAQSFRILRKCQNKFDCLMFEMFFIQELKPTLNKRCDSIRAKYLSQNRFLRNYLLFPESFFIIKSQAECSFL